VAEDDKAESARSRLLRLAYQRLKPLSPPPPAPKPPERFPRFPDPWPADRYEPPLLPGYDDDWSDVARAVERDEQPAEKPTVSEPTTPRKAFTLSRDDAIFWIGVAALGDGLYLMAEHPLYATILIAIGVGMLAWSNRGHMPRPSLRLAVLVLAMVATVSIAGYDLYDRHFGTTMSPVATGRVWAPLTDDQKTSLGLVLGALPQHDSFQVLCLNSDCRALAEDFMGVLNGIDWNPVLGGNNFYQEPYGAVLYQTDIKDRRLADAIEKTTKIKIAHIYPTSMPNVDSLFLGLRP
jgi:hypothetical protein